MDRRRDQAKAGVRDAMRHWQQDADLAGVRGADALARLPELERQPWQELWQAVHTLNRRAAAHETRP